LPMWNVEANWDYKVGKLARSLHLSKDLASEVLTNLERQRCYDNDCEGQMQVWGIKDAVKDINGFPYPRKTFYKCVKCGTKWVYDLLST